MKEISESSELMAKFQCKVNGENLDFELSLQATTVANLLEYIRSILQQEESENNDAGAEKIGIERDSARSEAIKVIWKGKRLDSTRAEEQDQSIAVFFGIEITSPAVKLIILSTSKESILDLEARKRRHDQALHNYHKALLTRPKHEITTAGYARKIEVLGEFSDHLQAREILMKVRDDPSIKQIMKTREWRIGSLIELHPHRDSTILGYNQNRGMVIALRLRTDALDGFRSYSAIIKVMLHELAHMIFSEHDGNFHALDRELNQDYARFLGASLGGSSNSSLTARATGQQQLVSASGPPQRLGGKSASEGMEMREILAEAASLRLTKEEEEIASSCGHGKTKG